MAFFPTGAEFLVTDKHRGVESHMVFFSFLHTSLHLYLHRGVCPWQAGKCSIYNDRNMMEDAQMDVALGLLGRKYFFIFTKKWQKFLCHCLVYDKKDAGGK